MHSALFVVELLFRIFDDPILASQPVGSYTTEQKHYLRRHPLLSLALGCKTFSPVALQVLWKEIDGIDQLLWTMSDDIIRITLPAQAEEREDSGSDSSSYFCSDGFGRPRKCMTFKKEPVEQDWEPFDRYGALVTGLKNRQIYALGDPLQLSPNVFEGLSARYDLQGTPLLLNLKSLTCHGQQLRYGHTLLGPQLHSLVIPDTLYYDLSYLQAFFQRARSNPPIQLDLLELTNSRNSSYEANHEEVNQLFSELVVNIQQKGEGLCRVRTDLLSWQVSLEALNLVLANERIRDVQACVEQFDLDRILPPDASCTRKDLRNVMIRAVKGVTNTSLLNPSFFHEFFRRLDARNLVRFTFWGGPRHLSVDDARTVFTFLHYEKGFTEDNTNEYTPAISISSDEDSGGITVDLDHICTFANSFYLACQPMSSADPTPRFAYLERLKLNVLVDLTDSDIGNLSSSMPKLTHFSVATNRAGRTGRSKTTLIGIWHFVKNCRDITSIGIWFNAVLDWEQFAVISQLDVESVNDEEGRQAALKKAANPNLAAMNVGDSFIANVDVAIEFFGIVCPSLYSIDDGEGEEWGWGSVRTALFGESDEVSSSYASSY